MNVTRWLVSVGCTVVGLYTVRR